MIRNKTSEERELVIAFKNKENGKGKKKRFKLEFFGEGEKWAEDFKRWQFDLIVFQTKERWIQKRKRSSKEVPYLRDIKKEMTSK